MTAISDLTNEQLDRHIAERRGWTYIDIDYWGSEKGLQKELGEDWFDTADGNDETIGEHWINISLHAIKEYEGEFRYTTDPRCAMELLKEMQEKGYHVRIVLNPVSMRTYVELESATARIKTIIADTPERAIAEAYVLWKGEK